MTLPDSSYRKESWRCCCTWVVVERWDYVGWHPKSLSFHHSDNPRTSNGLKKKAVLRIAFLSLRQNISSQLRNLAFHYRGDFPEYFAFLFSLPFLRREGC